MKSRAALAQADSVCNARVPDAFSRTAALLASGGDDRLSLHASTGLNRYGCAAHPRPSALSFASSTASSISGRGFERAKLALAAWDRVARQRGAWPALDQQVEGLREEFCDLFGLCVSDVDVVFSPSGTDSQLQALAVARATLGTPLTTLVVAADETGSGTDFTAAGRHFAARTASGREVPRGARLDGLDGVEAAVSIPANGPEGPRSIADIDEAVLAAVGAAARAGRKVMVLAMNASKFGRRCPSDACLDLIRRTHGGVARIVVDACQMRLGGERLRHHLDRGDMVLVTGSKFFTGPAFSGALLIPSRLCREMRSRDDMPAGLGDYASRQDWPSRHKAARDALPCRVGVGPWLRWEAALAEMRAYRAVPVEFRRFALQRFAVAADEATRGGGFRRLDVLDAGASLVDDEEFEGPTIFPFLVLSGSRPITADRASCLYAALNNDMEGHGLSVIDAARDLAARHCHIGQPVRLSLATGDTAALRVSADARFIVECWSSDAAEAHRRIEAHVGSLGLVFAKLDLLQSGCGL